MARWRRRSYSLRKRKGLKVRFFGVLVSGLLGLKFVVFV